MNKTAVYLIIGTLGISLACHARLTFDTIQPQVTAKPMEFERIDTEYLERALAVHNLIKRMDETQTQIRQKSLSKKNVEMMKEKAKELENCNIKRLAEHFKDPATVWEKMNSEFKKQVKELTVYANSAQGMTEQERLAKEKEMQGGPITEETLSEMFAYFNIGNAIVRDVYQNQDAWGERVSPKAPSFPLWADQKYLFDKEWDGTYTKINTYFGVPPQGRPAVGDEKYDYARAKDVQAAHTTYVTALAATNPAKAAALPAALREAPIAPKPLVPKEESILYIASADPARRVYPAMPEPWQKYAEGGYKNVAPDGEYARDFIGATLKDSAKQPTGKTNRLVAYALMEKSLEGATQIDKMVQMSVDLRVQALQDKLGDYINVDETLDLADPKVFERTLELLKQEKQTLIQKAERELIRQKEIDLKYGLNTEEQEKLESASVTQDVAGANPDAEIVNDSVKTSDELLLQALKKDKDSVVFLTRANAPDVDRLVVEAVAQKALETQQDVLAKETRKSKERQVDDLCLSAGL